jgi:hypothetical protein
MSISAKLYLRGETLEGFMKATLNDEPGTL